MKNMTFDAGYEQLLAIMAQLEDENTGVEQALALYEKAQELISFCADYLKTAKVKITEISAQIDSSLSEASID